MGSDSVTRQAARTATLIAVPIALVVAFVALWSAGAFDAAEPMPSATSAAPAPTTAVSMAAPSLPAEAAEVCRAIIADLPETLLGPVPNRTPRTANLR
jgi:hypothetical protein